MKFFAFIGVCAVMVLFACIAGGALALLTASKAQQQQEKDFIDF